MQAKCNEFVNKRMNVINNKFRNPDTNVLLVINSRGI